MLLTNNNYKVEVECLLKDSRAVNIAVAFWGKGAEVLLDDVDKETSRIICNLNMGGTNPKTIRHIRDAGYNIQHADNFHGKVLFGQKAYILGSANFSTNGLGLEGDQLANLQELGLKGEDNAVLQDLNAWFETLWTSSKKIKDKDLKKLEKIWAEGRTGKLDLSENYRSLKSSDFEGVKAYATFTYSEDDPTADSLLKKQKEKEKKRIGKDDDLRVDDEYFSDWSCFSDWPDRNEDRKGQSEGDLPVESFLIDVEVDKKMTKVIEIRSIYKRIPEFDCASGDKSIQMVKEVAEFGTVKNASPKWGKLLKQLEVCAAEYLKTDDFKQRAEEAHIVSLSRLLKEIGR